MTISIGFNTNQIPNYVTSVARDLIANNFQTYLVGGAIRDILIGRATRDFDIATDAKPDDILKIFPKSIATGAKFGNIIVVSEDEFGERHDVDVTTFREEADYLAGRWPSKVDFTNDINKDLSRRDFTINALAIDMKIVLDEPDKFLEIEKITDPFGGIEDILNRIIRTVGDPLTRLQEDGLRSFRACRLASQLDFVIDNSTKEAIKQSISISSLVSMERIRDEFIKLIKHSKVPSIGIKYMDELGLLKIIIPELTDAKSLVQPKWHEDDVFEHSLKSMDIAEDRIKIAALLHDIGKTKTRSEDEDGIHFYSHDVVGSEMAKVILKRMRFSNLEIERISNLIRWHMFYYPSAQWREENKKESGRDEKSLRNEKFKHGWSDSAIKRFIINVGGIEQIRDLIRLRIADANANKKSSFDPSELEALENRISEVLEKEVALKVSDLKINGKDLMDEFGLTPGAKIGNILNTLLDIVVEEPKLNTREILLNKAKEILSKNL